MRQELRCLGNLEDQGVGGSQCGSGYEWPDSLVRDGMYEEKEGTFYSSPWTHL